MTTMCRALLIALMTLCAAAPTLAQEPTGAAILKAADDAMRQRQTLAFEARAFGVGGRTMRTPEVEARVQARRAGKRAEFAWAFLAEGSSRWSDATRRAVVGRGGDPDSLPKGSATFKTSYDGSTVRTLRESGSLVIEGAWGSRDEALRDGAGYAMAWLLRWPMLVSEPFGGDDPSLPAEWEGQVEIDGEVCDVIHVDYSELNDPTLFDTWWTIARSDNLPRRVEFNLREGGRDGYLVMTIKPVATEPPAIEALALAAPEGWNIRKSKAPEPRAGRSARGGAIAVGSPAPDFTLEDPKGKLHTLSDMKGKVVLLDFWATWCGPCQAAMPGLQKLHEEFAAKGLVVIGMNCWESADPVAYMQENNFSYKLLLKADQTAQAYGVSGIPVFYLIDAEGNVAFSQIGFNPAAEGQLKELIEKLLGAAK